MSERQLPARPSLEQYKNQAKDLVRACALHQRDALARIRRHHPRYHKLSSAQLSQFRISRADAQLVLAREHGFKSWPEFAHHVTTLHLIESLDALPDPISAFIEVASVPRHTWHGDGTLDHARLILARYPHVATASIHTAAILADETAVRGFLKKNPPSAIIKGGPYDWDPLTYLCFSRYLRLDPARSEGFVRTAQLLLDAGAGAGTGFYEMIDHPNPRPTFESAIYAAAGIAFHPELTRLLLDHGADPNDEETPYHVPETYDNTVMKIILDSGKFNAHSLGWLLVRKADWHDLKGMRLALDYGADPNLLVNSRHSPFHHAVRRDNSMEMISLLLDHGADPSTSNPATKSTAASLAAHRGRGDILTACEARSLPINLTGVDVLIALCAKGDRAAAQSLVTASPVLREQLLALGGTLLAEFAGNNNTEGLHCLLALGIPINAPYPGDPYFEIPKDSSALHVAAWRASHYAVKFLIENGADVSAPDPRGRTPLMLAVRAATNSYWKDLRTTSSIAALLHAGASPAAINIPTGYDDADMLLQQYIRSQP